MGLQLSIALFLVVARAATEQPESQPTSSPATQSKLEEAIVAYKSVQFGRSIALLDEISKSGSEEEREAAKLYLGMNQLALGNPADARQEFEDLLDLNPDFVLPLLSSPTVRNYFELVKKTHKIIPVIKHASPAKVEASEGATLVFSIARMRPGYRARLSYRLGAKGGYASIDLSSADRQRYVADLPPGLLLPPGEPAKGVTLQYFVAITDADAALLTRSHTAEDPLVVPLSIPPPVARKYYETWWFWTALGGGAAVVAAVVATVVVVTRNTTTGQVQVGFQAR